MTDGLSPKPYEVEGDPKRGRLGQFLPAVELDRFFNLNETCCCIFAAGAVASNKRLRF